MREEERVALLLRDEAPAPARRIERMPEPPRIGGEEACETVQPLLDLGRRAPRRGPLERFLRGESAELLAELAACLLERPAARRAAAEVEERLHRLAGFFAADARRLRHALDAAGRSGSFVAQEERDALFLAHADRLR